MMIANAGRLKIHIIKGENFMENINKLSIGEHFTYGGLEWICLDKINGDVFAITAKPIDELPFDTDRKNNWRNSSIRRLLNGDFMEEHLNKKHLKKWPLDLIADNGDKTYGTCEDYVGILSCDQYRKYRENVPLFDEWMWTCTPWYIDLNSGTCYSVRFVDTTGTLNYIGASYSSGVVPACLFSSENLKLCRQAQLIECDEDE